MLVDILLPPLPPVSRIRFEFRLRQLAKCVGKLFVPSPCRSILCLHPRSDGLASALSGLACGLLPKLVGGIVKVLVRNGERVFVSRHGDTFEFASQVDQPGRFISYFVDRSERECNGR